MSSHRTGWAKRAVARTLVVGTTLGGLGFGAAACGSDEPDTRLAAAVAGCELVSVTKNGGMISDQGPEWFLKNCPRDKEYPMATTANQEVITRVDFYNNGRFGGTNNAEDVTRGVVNIADPNWADYLSEDSLENEEPLEEWGRTKSGNGYIYRGPKIDSVTLVKPGEKFPEVPGPTSLPAFTPLVGTGASRPRIA